MFNQNRFVEMYKMETFERELGVDRDKLIEMALLLGSDYTEGVHGIGIVNALEIVNAFQDLAEFRDWVYSSEVTKKPADTVGFFIPCILIFMAPEFQSFRNLLLASFDLRHLNGIIEISAVHGVSLVRFPPPK